ncbi:MAG: FAD-dependent oxidoreductase [Chlorobiaceae bacterium]|nr:FAD-dependent oxidoreductase [Chlorobiaceae bacterium]
MKSVSLTIDGRSVSVDPGLSILEAARSSGIHIPTLCFHEALPSKGSCWLCIVELKGQNRFIPACNTTVSEGMVVETSNAELDAMRRQSLERIIAVHCGDCLGPCELSCPAGCNIPGFVAAIASGRDDDALRIIRDTIPLPGILGRVCPAPCEDACRRHGVDEPVSICALKRFTADQAFDTPSSLPVRKPSSGKKVAVVGAGPAGLAAAWFLLTSGHEVTIIDANEKAGGMMRYGIPKFRLPDAVIDADIAPIMEMGARFMLSTTFGRDIDWSMLKKEHDALFLSIGAAMASPLNIPGEELDGVVSGIGFLREAASGNARNPGRSVVVIGGGNTAIDAARTALRLGAESVTVMYRRGREEMPANRIEIEEAIAEGIELRLMSAPTGIEPSIDGLVITAVSMSLGEPDASGRRRPVPVEGSEFTVSTDTVITATGQYVSLPEGAAPGIGVAGNGNLLSRSGSMQTDVPEIFAGGDCVTGPDLAIRAIEQGRLAAEAIDRFLNGLSPEVGDRPFNSSYGERDLAPRRFYERARPAARVPVPELPATERRRSFREAVSGYGVEDARKEAMRCLQCRCRAVDDCLLRDLATAFGVASCPGSETHEDFSIDSSGAIRFEREKCVDCGICVRTIESNVTGQAIAYVELIESCPTGAISGRKS